MVNLTPVNKLLGTKCKPCVRKHMFQSYAGFLEQTNLTIRVAKSLGGQVGGTRVQAVLPGGHSEHVRYLFGVGSVASHAEGEVGLIEFSVANGRDAIKDLVFAIRIVLMEPITEDVLRAVGKPQHDIRGESGAGSCRGFKNLWNLMIGESGNYWGHKDAGGDARIGQLADGFQAAQRRGCSWLQLS